MASTDGYEEKNDSVSHISSDTSSISQEKEVESLSIKVESLKTSELPEADAPKHSDKKEALDEVSDKQVRENENFEEFLPEEKLVEPVFDGTETLESDTQASSVWPDKAVALKNFVKEKGTVVVSTFIRHLSSKKEEEGDSPCMDEKSESDKIEVTESELKEVNPKPDEKSMWNPLSFLKIGRDVLTEQTQNESLVEVPAMKGRIVIYTQLGCQECKTVRSFMRKKRLSFVEINIDVFPSRKLELEKKYGSYVVPRVYFNDVLIGGLKELSDMEASGLLDNKINEIMNVEAAASSPFPPLPGEDDESASGKLDELAAIVRKMKEVVKPKDRYYKMRRFSNCFLGSEAVDFLSEDQYFEREEAVEFGRKLVINYFFRHVLDENIFEDGNHLYRFLEHDPVVMSQCYNIPKGTLDVLPKPIVEISSRLQLLSRAVFEAYVSEDGRHVDYRSIHGSEEFKRYVRITEELQRVDLEEISREESLAFFINLYNMMAIHAILSWGPPIKAMERRKFFGDFKYVIGGFPYSLSAIHNGILRSNQRPPYSLTKPFAPRDKRSKVSLPYPEPLVHFALVNGTRSGPALRCYSPGNIDKELMEAARDFIRNGGLIIDAKSKAASANKILHWYSVDFGKNETEVLKHAANYMETAKSAELMELLANSHLKVTYQPYDWSLNI
ncbi:Glutaredoxin [Carex littledalei]|uniref:Glutaredoxin n=1 Tax=Carex littledalei TaxID=544730 RepID=A0A833R387_9POAL|nr:Glutaredoxin [Carex littledalei]